MNWNRLSPAFVDDGHLVCDWSRLTNYTKLPGIPSLHDFVFIKNSIDNTVVAKVRKTCFSGRYKKYHNVHCQWMWCQRKYHPWSSESYHALQRVKVLSETKCKHLQQTYKDFVPRDQCMPFITLPWTLPYHTMHALSLYCYDLMNIDTKTIPLLNFVFYLFL